MIDSWASKEVLEHGELAMLSGWGLALYKIEVKCYLNFQNVYL